MTVRCVTISAAVLCLMAGVASAHSLNLFVHDDGGSIKGNAYFTGGTPAQNVAVRVQDADGNTLGETTTDAEGNFVYAGPRGAGTTVFVVSTTDGHRAESEIRSTGGAAPGRAQTPLATESAVMSYEAQLANLHAAIDRLEKRLWLRDVLGGIGYIFGLAGLWALWKARSGGRSH